MQTINRVILTGRLIFNYPIEYIQVDNIFGEIGQAICFGLSIFRQSIKKNLEDDA